jgi:hypothetical protein
VFNLNLWNDILLSVCHYLYRERMELYNLKERRTIPGDGNCQMYSLSDQLYGTLGT